MIESIEELQKFLSGLPDGRSVRLSAVTSSGKVRIEYMLAGLLVQFLLQAEVGRELSESALKEALSRGWLSRGKADKPLWEKHKEQERQALIAALAERDRLGPDAPNAIAFKHDPYCDCGICQYCRGDEDKFGNPTRSKEVESIREKVLITASIECSECDDAKTENLQGGNLRTLRPEFAMIVWKYGWVVELDKVLCPNCRADAEEWRSI